MCTRSQSRNSNRQQQQVNPTFVEPFNLVEPIENQAPPVVTMVEISKLSLRDTFSCHLVFTLPRKLRTSPRVPTYLDNRNTALLQMLDFAFHDLDRFLNEVEFFVDLDFIQRIKISLDEYYYFVGKRVAFSVVENYVKNAWKKFGLVCVMMKSKGFFSFKFASIEGMNGVLENGLWFIRYAPIILKKWTPNVDLLKEDMNSFPIWVKFYDIPIVAFTADGLSVMDTKLGNPIMLNSYTSSMCLQSWGRMDYARALIDIRADRELKEDMIIAILNGKDDGEVLRTVRINALESQITEGKLLLLDDDGKSLNPSASTLPSYYIVVSKKVDVMVKKDNDTLIMNVTPPDAKKRRGPIGGVEQHGSKARSPTTSGALRRQVMVLAPGQPIPYGRPYRYHLNGPVHMMTVRKRVGPLPTHRLAVRHSVDYSSLDHFSLDDSSSSSSSETSSDSPADALSDYPSSHSSSDHSLPASPLGTRSSHRLCFLVLSVHRSSAISERLSHDSSSVSRSRKRSRSPIASVPLSSPTFGALSYALADILPSPKRIRSPEIATDLEDCSDDRFEPYVPGEVGLKVNFEDESSEPSRSRGANLVMDVDVVRSDRIEIDPEIQAEIDECFTYADALRDRGIDARVVVDANDTPEPAQEGAVEVTYETLGDLGSRIVGAESAVTILTERVAELERDNRRLRGTASVESQRVGRLQSGMVRMQRELRQIRWRMPNTRSGESRTREAVNEQSDRRMAGALRVRDSVRNLRPLIGDEVEQEEVGGNGNGGNRDRGNGNRGNGDGGNGKRGNGNGNGNGGEYGYNFRGFMPARECTYQDFLMCQPLNFNGNREFSALTVVREMECFSTISNCPADKYLLKVCFVARFEQCIDLWNSQQENDLGWAAYAMSWAENL
ncbi:putative reverse transcriptase domain-containing protein [Tanacetum coccineum]|uniref:Reverse transcriptase domain-containing protein n=1 Tax=Tanacetum coccineum TaxID=301880 RepID=A0ABQ5GHI5_9ASTR